MSFNLLTNWFLVFMLSDNNQDNTINNNTYIFDKVFKMFLMHFMAKYTNNNSSVGKDFAFMGAVLTVAKLKQL